MLYIKDIIGEFIGKGDFVVFCMNNRLKTGIVTKICPEKVAVEYTYGNVRPRKVYVNHANVIKVID